MYSAAILVLIFNKEIRECLTLNSLISLDVHFENTKLIIWNNGPLSLHSKNTDAFSSLGYNVEIIETLHNESLAKVYNEFSSSVSANKYIFLDDDSEITSEYVVDTNLCNTNDIAMPIITFSGNICAPLINGKPYRLTQSIKPECRILTIGSGLVIGGGVLAQVADNYGKPFDERFYLYGVDTSFCLRIFKLELTNKINFIRGFEHSLSRLQGEEGITDFRRKERSYDVALTIRHYYSFYESLKVFYRVLKDCLVSKLFKKNNHLYLYHFFRGYISGRHYRNQK